MTRAKPGLFDGTRVRKDDARVSAYGDVDELNAVLGLALAFVREDDDLGPCLFAIQRDLFTVGAQLADPSARVEAKRGAKAAFTEDKVSQLEEWIDRFETQLEPLRQFILPGGSKGGATLHLARTRRPPRRTARRRAGPRDRHRPPHRPLPEPPVGLPVRRRTARKPAPSARGDPVVGEVSGTELLFAHCQICRNALFCRHHPPRWQYVSLQSSRRTVIRSEADPSGLFFAEASPNDQGSDLDLVVS